MPLYTKAEVVGKKCRVTDLFTINVQKRVRTKIGTVVGCYVNEFWHPNTYKAFHVEFECGTKRTYWAKDVKIIA